MQREMKICNVTERRYVRVTVRGSARRLHANRPLYLVGDAEASRDACSVLLRLLLNRNRFLTMSVSASLIRCDLAFAVYSAAEQQLRQAPTRSHKVRQVLTSSDKSGKPCFSLLSARLRHVVCGYGSRQEHDEHHAHKHRGRSLWRPLLLPLRIWAGIRSRQQRVILAPIYSPLVFMTNATQQLYKAKQTCFAWLSFPAHKKSD